MRAKLVNDLLILDVLAVLLLIIVILFPSNILRIILGLPFVLFLPGYALIAAIYPRRHALSGIERVALSLGLSVVVAILIGIVLNYFDWGIRLYSVLISLTVFFLTTSLVAWYQRLRLPEAERLTVSVSFSLGLVSWKPRSALQLILFIVLGTAILGALSVLGYVAALPKGGEEFTQFYISGPGGKAVSYPNEVLVGKEAEAVVTIVNQEHEAVSYHLQLRINGVDGFEVGPLLLEHGEKWEEMVSFTMDRPGNNQKVEFLLYRGDEDKPCLGPLHLWVNVEG